ncbi:integrase [Desulfosarcina ovata]|nr:integrase [Desulfosarcina ovata]BBO88362.1 hypothetical protein DSCOOX_15420 [Desulfosarcina ovata subsp. ovata]
MDQYRKTGVIPKPLLLAGQGIMEGRKCSGRRRVLTEKIQNRFIEMVKASSDPSDDRFVFITRHGRTIKNYHAWLEQEFERSISLSALRRFARQANLKVYLEKPDFEEKNDPSVCFKDEPVFDLIQMDGCRFRYFKIRSDDGVWAKPQVIEFFDTGSRNMLVLDAYFSESSLNSVDLFEKFLVSTPFPQKKIRLRPDNAKGFVNLKRPINELNIKFSLPGGFYLQPNFSRIHAPKDKAHLESSHRSIHHFEMRIIKHFEDRIVKTEPGYIYKKGKKGKITITYLDIDLATLRQSGLLEAYRRQHNEQKHYYSVNGKTSAWVPKEKFDDGLAQYEWITFSADDVRHFVKYGYDKINATVGAKGIITFKKQTYYVAVGAQHFSRHKSTKVYISDLGDKLFIFEHKENGILLGEALRREPYEKPVKKAGTEPNAVELISAFLQEKKMAVDRPRLIDIHLRGLTLDAAQTIYRQHRKRYIAYAIKLRQPETITGKALFNAFILDCERQLSNNPLAPYASCSENKVL